MVLVDDHISFWSELLLMFRGTTSICLDNKGRLTIPTRYRDTLEESMIATIDIYQSCLLLYPLAEWKIIEQELSTLSALNSVERRVQRLLLGHANECQIDNSGRILIPVSLRQYVKLRKHIMLVGQLNKFEIWDEEAWYKQIEEDLGTISSDMDCLLSDKLKNLTL